MAPGPRAQVPRDGGGGLRCAGFRPRARDRGTGRGTARAQRRGAQRRRHATGGAGAGDLLVPAGHAGLRAPPGHRRGAQQFAALPAHRDVPGHPATPVDHPSHPGHPVARTRAASHAHGTHGGRERFGGPDVEQGHARPRDPQRRGPARVATGTRRGCPRVVRARGPGEGPAHRGADREQGRVETADRRAHRGSALLRGAAEAVAQRGHHLRGSPGHAAAAHPGGQ